MVVPIPNPHNLQEFDFTLFKVSNDVAKTLRRHAEKLMEPYNSASEWMPAASTDLDKQSATFGSGAPSLTFQRIGGYNISVAPSLLDLESRAPWTKFQISHSTVTTILKDIRKRYPSNFAFIIAQASPGGVDQAGFSVLYRDARPNGGFFPTSHEPPKLASRVSMDVNLVALGSIIRPLSLLQPREYFPMRNQTSNYDPVSESRIVLRGDDMFYKCISRDPKWIHASEIVRNLPVRGASSIHENTFVEHERVRVLTTWSLKGTFDNGDVIARKADRQDEEAVDKLYADLNAWLEYANAVGVGNKPFTAPPRPRSSKINMALELLARQLSDPGLHDRISDVINPRTGEKSACGPVAYMNLDVESIDLDEESYANKEDWARFIQPSMNMPKMDTKGTTYVRISAKAGPVESLDMRRVK